MHVDAAQSWCRQHRFGQQKTVGDDDRNVRAEPAEQVLLLWRFQANRMPDLNAALLGETMHRRGGRIKPASPRGTRWLGVDGFDRVSSPDNGLKCGHREIRRTHKDYVETHAGRLQLMMRQCGSKASRLLLETAHHHVALQPRQEIDN